ncbi:MAG: hypothetical protein OIF58_05155 [Cohaesibacter sp.]|nr:hypothetical protein [Cohaesibacter sp.]
MNSAHDNILMKSGQIFVTQTVFGFRGHRYKINHIENLILKRPLLHIGLTLQALVIAFGIINSDLLYTYEQITIFSLAAITGLVTWPFATLEIHSRTLSTSHGSVTWFYKDLAKAQDMIITLISERDRATPPQTHDPA